MTSAHSLHFLEGAVPFAGAVGALGAGKDLLTLEGPGVDGNALMAISNWLIA